MEERLKRRLIGAVVLVSLAVIFLPMLLEDRQGQAVRIDGTNIPKQPEMVEDFRSKVMPLPDDEPLIPPMAPEDEPPAAFAPSGLTEGSAAEEAVETEPEPRVGLSAWVVQLASLSNKENADKLVSDLRKEGYSAFLEQVYVKGKNLFRVRVGPEIDRRRAERTMQEIQKLVKLKGQVIRYP